MFLVVRVWQIRHVYVFSYKPRVGKKHSPCFIKRDFKKVGRAYFIKSSNRPFSRLMKLPGSSSSPPSASSA